MKRRLVAFTLAMLSILALSVVFKDFVRDAIVVPIAYIVWTGGLLIESLPQIMVWIVLLLVGVALAVAGALARPHSVARVAEVEASRRGQVETLSHRIGLSRRGYYFRWHLAQRLNDLAIDAIAHRQKLERGEARKQLLVGALDIPPDIRGYLLADLAIGSAPGRLSVWHRFRRGASTDSPLDLAPERVVEFIETQMEAPLDELDR